MADTTSLKRRAAEAALAFVRAGEVLGVGTGSTVDLFIDLVAERMPGAVPAAVSSSLRSEKRLRERGIAVVELDAVLAERESAGLAPDAPAIGVYVDGADECGPGLVLIKGGGGALTREKIVAEASGTFVCVADRSKVVAYLGAFPLPVEVIPMATRLVAQKLRALGGRPQLRAGFTTDNGNAILDVHDLAIRDPHALEAAIESIPGVVTAGLFARRPADIALIAGPEGVCRLNRPRSRVKRA